MEGSNLAAISGRLVEFANAQTTRINRVSQNVATTSDAFAGVAKTFQGAVARLDTATSDDQLKDIMNNGRKAVSRPVKVSDREVHALKVGLHCQGAAVLPDGLLVFPEGFKVLPLELVRSMGIRVRLRNPEGSQKRKNLVAFGKPIKFLSRGILLTLPGSDQVLVPLELFLYFSPGRRSV